MYMQEKTYQMTESDPEILYHVGGAHKWRWGEGGAALEHNSCSKPYTNDRDLHDNVKFEYIGPCLSGKGVDVDYFDLVEWRANPVNFYRLPIDTVPKTKLTRKRNNLTQWNLDRHMDIQLTPVLHFESEAATLGFLSSYLFYKCR